MDRQNVISSNLKSVGYDAQNYVLEVEFKTSGVYQFFGVSENVFKNLMAAQAHGSYFNANIKNTYRNLKIR